MTAVAWECPRCRTLNVGEEPRVDAIIACPHCDALLVVARAVAAHPAVPQARLERLDKRDVA